MNLASSVSTIPGVGEAYVKKLTKLEIDSIFDLLYHIPFRYEDRTQIKKINQIKPGEKVTLVVTIDEISNQFLRSHKTLQKAVLSDETGQLTAAWFNQQYLPSTLKKGLQIGIYGEIERFGNKLKMTSPDFEIVSPSRNLVHMGRIVPVYPETAGLTSKWFRHRVGNLLQSLNLEPFPKSQSQLSDWLWSLKTIHFPKSLEETEKARKRLAYDELVILQTVIAARKARWQEFRLSNQVKHHVSEVEKFISSLPFALTDSQLLAIKEILSDMEKPTPMNRMLEGDVGSGKTVVAATVAFNTYKNHLQTLLLAPTQILATQHFTTIDRLFSPHGIKVKLLTSGQKLKPDEDFDILIGTHAVLFKEFDAKKVGLIVIDEQHRFGVMQRSWAGKWLGTPHVLTMTATPIPRSIALAKHGDLDVSILTSVPTGRLPIKTWLVAEDKRAKAYDWIKTEIVNNQARVYIVCPFVEPSETAVTVKSAITEYERIQKLFPGISVGLVHGKQKPSEKDNQLNKFKSGETQILVATPVVEVGIDVPEATIIVIEDADRFGLAQLHQLRGRVGRSNLQSYCLLFAQNPNSARLKALETHNSGSELAEIDFRLRGPGEMYGTRQHGISHFKIATYADFDLFELAKETAATWFTQLDKYPTLQSLVEKAKIDPIEPN